MSGIEYNDDAVRLPPIFEGDSFGLIVEVYDEEGAIVDLTGYTIRFLLGSLNEESSGATVSVNEDGAAQIEITYTAMAALPVGDYDVAVEVTDSSGYRTTLFTGQVEVKEDIR